MKLQCWMVLFELLLCQYRTAHFSFSVLKQFRFDAIQFMFSAKFWLWIPTDDWTLFLLFCHSFGSRLRLMLRLMKDVFWFCVSVHAAWDCRLRWLRDGSDGAIRLLRLLPRAGYVERLEPIVVWRPWFARSLRPGKPSNPPRAPGWARGELIRRLAKRSVERTPSCRGRHDGAGGAISTKQNTYDWALNEAIIYIYKLKMINKYIYIFIICIYIL